ncbi:MAG: type I pantothenate kinase [Pseudomonadota bacterium]
MLDRNKVERFDVDGDGEPDLLDQLADDPNSPFRSFTAAQWAELRADTPLSLTEEEVNRLRALGDPIDLDEVRRIYLPLSRMLAMHVEAMSTLHAARTEFMQDVGAHKSPFIIGIAGSVAVGKSTTARLLTELLKRWPLQSDASPKVQLITTDGFLHPNAYLEEHDLMSRKGFPESYDVKALLGFLADIKAGRAAVRAPVYSHMVYDVVPGEFEVVDQPDILVFEGINVLQTRELPPEGRVVPFVSDFFDFSIFVDADEDDIERWYVARFMDLWRTAFRDKTSFFHRFTELNAEEAEDMAHEIWTDINLKNLHDNIQPTRPRADLILRKGQEHLVEQVLLRRL